MTALSRDRNTPRRGMMTSFIAYPVAAGAQIFVGAKVTLNADGFAVPAADTAGHRFVGVARQWVDNRAGGDGAVTIEVFCCGEFLFDGAGLVAADVNRPVFVTDDQTFGLATANSIPCGCITEVVSATKAWICIDHACRHSAAAMANLAGAPTQADFNNLLARLRAAGLMAQ